MNTTKFWHWPDRTIGKRESRQLREEHNAVVNENVEMREALKAMGGCPDYNNIGTHEMRAARAVLAKIEGRNP